MRRIHQHVPMLFEPDGWQIVEKDFSDETNKNNETIFALGNGYLGVRGTFEEGFNGYQGFTNPGTFINGIYEYHDYHHIWCRPGFPTRYHSIVNQVEAFEAKLYIDGEEVKLVHGKVLDYRRVLDMKRGLLTRSFTYQTEKGVRVSLIYERFISMAEKHTTAMRIDVTTSRDCEVVLESILDGEIKRIDIVDGEKGIFLDDCFDFCGLDARDGTASALNRTKRSGFEIAACMRGSMAGKAGELLAQGKRCVDRYVFRTRAGQRNRFERVTCYGTNRDFERVGGQTEALTRAQSDKGYEALRDEHEKEWEKFWNFTGIDIEGDTAILQGVRYAAFQLNQSAGRDGITNISANGLTGVGYSGHTFWDTEIFMLPMFLYTQPDVARQLLIYRYNILDKARERARQMDDQGALFAWNSINGEECGHVFEAVTAAYHIEADIGYAIWHYMQVTQDEDFLVRYGAEILFETSKCLAHRGSFIPLRDHQFCINVVCGPDEYTPVVDNNCYTNWMCRRHLYYTLETAELLRTKYPRKYAELLEKCGVDDQELALWKRAADHMYIPYHKGLGIYMQDDQFLYRDPIDIEKIPVEKLPLLTHLHPLNLWRYQVCKQADIVLLIYLCGGDFTTEMKKKLFDFYEPKTIHDSSLSAGTYAIVACEIGYADEAYGYFKQAARMDLDNVNRNTFLGIHSACMGNTWQILTAGFGGMRLYDGELHFKPYLPKEWRAYRFNILFRGSRMNVQINRKEAIFTHLEGGSISFLVNDGKVRLDNDNKTARIALTGV